jgi:FkbM family methyltransferase
MKKITSIIHTIIRKMALDNFAAKHAEFIPFLRKFVPEPFEYEKNSIRRVIRNGVKYELLINDYMQWFIYANMPDNSWRYALKCVSQNGPSAVVIDIGANVGAFSLSLAKGCLDCGLTKTEIVSFEPNPNVYTRLLANIANNIKLNPLIKSEILAIGNQVGITGMVFEPENTGHGRISDADGNCVSIEMTTLDKYFRDKKLRRLDFIKIDVEGYEPFVIDGAMQTIKIYKPDIYIEITPSWFNERGRSSSSLFDTLSDLGYQFFYDDIDKLVPLEEKNNCLPFQYNVLASCNVKKFN